MPAGGEVDGALEVQLGYDVVFVGGRGLGCEGVVQVVDVRLVVLGVVEGHDLSADRRLQGLGREFVSVLDEMSWYSDLHHMRTAIAGEYILSPW